MIGIEFARSRPTISTSAVVTIVGALLGVVFYTLISARVLSNLTIPFFGMEIYDQLFLALRDGRLDLPARVLRFEGHYWPDGTAHLYHGMAPLLTRVLLAPFVEIGTVSLAPVSVWFWGTLGTFCWHMSFAEIARKHWPEDGRAGAVWAAVLALLVWLCAPGLLLVVNFVLYNEPIVVAYALTAAFVLVWTRTVARERPIANVLWLLALLAAIAVHARPNVAVGLYAGTVFAAGLVLLRDRWRAVRPALLAMAILFAGGVAFLGLNAAKFGNVGQTHGTFEADGVQYGTTFWGADNIEGKKAAAFIEHGRFNLARIPANLMVYGAAPPQLLASRSYDRVVALHASLTEDRLGFIRIEKPGAGAIFLWTGFCVLAGIGLCSGIARLRPYAGLVLAAGTIAVVTLSYGTITLRYHVEIFPIIGVLALVGCGRFAPWAARARSKIAVGFLALVVCAVGAVSSGATALYSSVLLNEDPGTFFEPWSEEMCLDHTGQKNFAEARARQICRQPYGPAGAR
ncbi:hypothetical protein [Tropicimonas marinistellae]|uniref:hypothetical protein n=1 Tax=Tropicimonas marinistellae TaxID=1739787 RepID=UPI0008354062|nr:hypothetical protein [Tropicimonas marinistellae]